MCAGLCPTYWTTFGITEKNRNGSCPMHEWDHLPIFFEFLTPSLPAPRGRWTPQGEGHVDRHRPYTNNIWCGSVHALLRYRSTTAKMQKFPIDSHSNENFICLFFPPAGGRQPPKGEKTRPDPGYARMQTLACFGPRVVEKSLTEQKTTTSASVKLTQTRHTHSK